MTNIQKFARAQSIDSYQFPLPFSFSLFILAQMPILSNHQPVMFGTQLISVAVIVFDGHSRDDSILDGDVSIKVGPFYQGAIPVLGINKIDGLRLKKLIETDNPYISIDCDF